MAEIQSMKHYNAIPILKVCQGKLTKVLRQEQVTNLEEKIFIRKSLFTTVGLDQSMLQADGKKKAHFELRIVRLGLSRIGCELLELSRDNLQLSWQFMEFPESIVTSSNLKDDILEFELSVLYKIEDYDRFSKFLESGSVQFNLIVLKEENYIKIGSGQTFLSNALNTPKSRISEQVEIFHTSGNREEPIYLGTLDIWYLLDFGKKIVSTANILDPTCKAEMVSLFTTPKSPHSMSIQLTENTRSSIESMESLSTEFSQFNDVDVTDSEVKVFQEALFLVLNRNKALKTTQSEISRELKDRSEWLNEEAIWRRTLQEYAILCGKNPFDVQWRQWRSEDTSQVLLRSFPIQPQKFEPTLVITICHVLFFPQSKPYENDTINRIYIEYTFLHMDGPEMEAEESLPIPSPNTEITFNFKKTYSIDFRRNREICFSLSFMIRDRIPLKISVVAEPKPNPEELIQTCTEIGYCEVDFFEVVQLETNSEQLDYQIFDSVNKNVIGTMTVEISGILALRKMALLTLAPEEYNLIRLFRQRKSRILLICGLGVHTVCSRKNECGPMKGCVTIESDVAFREHMVNVHNELRNKIASGSIKEPYGNKGAENMQAISYDMELEYIATCWNNECNTLQHDLCRDTTRFMVGQNIWWGMGMNGTAVAVNNWFDEIQYFTDANWLTRYTSSNYPQDGNERGHFTQVIWADTRYIGCSRIQFGIDSTETQLICNYGPAGNVIGSPIYKMADDTTKIAQGCENGINKQYTSLCGTIDEIPSGKTGSGSVKIIPIPFLIIFLSIFIAS